MFKKLLFIFLLLFPQLSWATIYAVKPDGTCTAANKANAVHATIAAVTAEATAANCLSITTAGQVTNFSGGDIVAFSAKDHSGNDANYAAFLEIGSSGSSSSSKLTYQGISDSSTGTCPIIANASTAVGMESSNKSNWTFDNFKIATTTANADAISFYTTGTHDYITISNVTIDMSGATGTRRAIACSAKTFDHLTLQNLTITGANGTPIAITNATASSFTNASFINVSITGGTYSKLQNFDAPTFNGLTITSATSASYALWLLSGSGVFTGSNINMVSGPPLLFDTCAYSAGSTLSGLTITGGTVNGALLSRGSTNVAVSNMSISTTPFTGVSFDTAASSGWSFTTSTIDGASGGYYVGGGSSNISFTGDIVKNGTGHAWEIAQTGTNAITLTRCLAINNGTKTSTSLGCGFDVHDNASAIAFNYCIAANNVEAGFGLLDTSSGTAYNCIAYQNGGAWHTGYTQWDGTVISANGALLDSNRAGWIDSSSGVWTIKNNISVGNWPYEITCSSSNPVFDYNLFSPISANAIAYNFQAGGLYTWAAWKAAAFTPDVHSPSPADPKWISHPANGASVLAATDFKLQGNSPAINAGVDVSLTTDYYGQAILGGYPEIGASEFTGNRWGSGGAWGASGRWGVPGY